MLDVDIMLTEHHLNITDRLECKFVIQAVDARTDIDLKRENVEMTHVKIEARCFVSATCPVA